MFNFHINFEYPWLFFLLIPAFAIVLIPHFLTEKKYRRNRNKITSLVLSMLVMSLCTLVLVGTTFSYEIYNSENEIILLVDASYSTQEEKDAKDNYVRDVIKLANPKVYSVGVVTFGYDQQYAVPLSNKFSGAFEEYLNAPVPDTSATNLAAALNFASEQFTKPESAKIILLSDGVETDESAMNVIKTIATRGTRVDTVCCKTLTPESEVQIVGADLPTYNVSVDEKFTLTLNLQSKFEDKTPVTVDLADTSDSGTETSSVTAEATSGVTSVTIEHTFKEAGLHILNFTVAATGDAVAENNSFCTYMYLTPHENILIIQGFDGESERLTELLGEKYKPVVKTVGDETMPKTLAELREYDEVILNNVAAGDLTEEFTAILDSYVHEAGGGLFTVGGGEPGQADVPHAYNREDMIGTKLQQMLPVEAIDYTPPVAVVFIVDVSGSMDMESGVDGKNKLDVAKEAAMAVVNDPQCLTTRDYCGVMTLSNSYSVETNLMPMTRADKILKAIEEIDGTGGTNFSPALDRASQAVRALYTAGTVRKMHVVMITDGAAADVEDYMQVIEQYRPEEGPKVSYSFVAICASDQDMTQLIDAAEAGGGRAYNPGGNTASLDLKEDICAPSIKDVEYGEFIPTLKKNSSYDSFITQEQVPPLYGFYGTREKRDESVEVVLSGEYGVPIYAQWRYGAGMVGSFMCDLNGVWSDVFMKDENGRNFLDAVVNKLFPVGDIRAEKITVEMREDNYKTQLSIYPATELGEDETMSISVANLSQAGAEIQITQPSLGDSYSRATIIAKQPGLYKITVQRMKNDTLVAETTVYKTLSYSEEYVMFSETDGAALLASLSAEGKGRTDALADADPYTAYEGFVTGLPRTYDPRILFISLAIALFLLDIAVRKFKFKWPHELIREAREKRKKA